MRKILLAWVFVASAVQAQEISCPKFYPSEDTVLTGTPYQHSGTGVLKNQELSSAGWMGGGFNDTYGEMAGGSDRVKGGADIVVPTFARWFVCWYGGGRAVAWWEELKPDTVNAGSCKIRLRNKIGSDPMDIKLVCK
jgi:hypothetical protein